MTDDSRGERGPNGSYAGPSRSAPYGLSRLAPAFDLVDVAREIQRSDEVIATMTAGKLTVIAEQMRTLQEQARALLARADRDATLHRAECRFEKRAGGEYHLYRRDADGKLWFSLLGPEEWSRPQPQRYEGRYRLEGDMSFTRVDVEPDGSADLKVDPRAVKALLGARSEGTHDEPGDGPGERSG